MKMKFHHILFFLGILLQGTLLGAQDYSFMSDPPDDFQYLDTTPQKRKFFNEHMIGVKYGVNISNVRSTPKIKQSSILTYNNITVNYTFYHVLWDRMANFGLQIGAKYGCEGYESEYGGYGETCKIVEIPMLSQFHINFSSFRLLVDVGPYYGYRLSTDREGGFDKYDQRHDYGIIAGAGFAVVLRPIELHLEACYKFALASMYHANKYSDLYWLYCYPSNIMFTLGINLHLDRKH
ncbi:MAG: PorT family protein [Bacteroidales bacterium]|nr:PorT family protein [Bacteroidales bacterium]